MTQEEINGAVAQVATQVKSDIESKVKGLASVESVTELGEKLKSVETENVTLKEALKEQAKTMNDLKRIKSEITHKHVTELLKSDEIKTAFTDLKLRKGDVNFEVKADPGVVMTSNISPSVAGGAKLSLLGTNGELFYLNRMQGESILDAVTVTNVDKASISYVDEVEGNGNVATTAEGAPKSQMDVSFQEMTENATKKTGFVKVTNEMLDDVSYTSEAIRRAIDDKLDIQIQNDVIEGIVSKATTYNITDYDGKVEKASMMDVINAAIAQSMLSGFTPSTIVLNPIDVISLRFIKSTDGTPVVNYFNEGKLAMLNNGLVIRMNKLMKKGDFVLGDMSRYRVMMYKRSINIGLDGDDFTKNRVTILAEARYIKMCSTNEKTTFVKGTFAAIMAKISKPETAALKGAA